jgi:hypothetical protein
VRIALARRLSIASLTNVLLLSSGTRARVPLVVKPYVFSLRGMLADVGVKEFHTPDLKVSRRQSLQRLRLPSNYEKLAFRARRFPCRPLRMKLLSLRLDAQWGIEHAFDQDVKRRDGSAFPEEVTGDLREEIESRLHR